MTYTRQTKKTPVTLLAAAIGLALQLAALSSFAADAAVQAQPVSPTADEGKVKPKVEATMPTAPGDKPAAVVAQEATDLEAIEVTGNFRASLELSLDVKRYAVDQIDAIVAEDIGKFPDLNLAESMQRIPGISIDRDAGEGRSITVRGLGQDFTRVRINGLEALATTGGTDSSGGANRGRGFDFNVFASDLFSKLTVRKTQSAKIDEGSLGATVDLQVARPFDYEGFNTSFSGQMGYNDLSKNYDYRASALITDTWLDGRFGALLSVSTGERNSLEEGFSTVRWDTGTSSQGWNLAGSVPAAYAQANSATVYHPRLPRYGRLTHHQERTGVTTSLQFKPVDGTLLNFDALYSKLDATRNEDFLEAISFSRNASQAGKPQTGVRDVVVDADGSISYGLFNGVDVRSESRYDELSTTFQQYSLNWQQDLGERFKLDTLIGTSKSEFDNPVQTTVTLDQQNINGYSWDFRGNDRLPTLHYPFDVNSTTVWRYIPGLNPLPLATNFGSEIRIRPNGAENTFDTAKVDLQFVANETFTLSGGLSYKKYENRTWEYRRNNETATPALPLGTTVADISTYLTDFGRGLDNAGNNASGWLTPDLDAIARLFNIYCNCNTGVTGGDFTLGSVTVGNARGGNREIEEKDTGGYVQMDFNTDMLGRALRGNVGVRYAKTEIHATGYTQAGGGTAVTVDNDYNDWLPSLNLAWDVADDVVLRFGAAKVMARPQLTNLSPGGTVSTSGQPTITTGNPLLEPFRATTYDLSAEWYFAEQSMLSVAFFYKDIDTYIQTLRESRPFSTTGLPVSLLPPGYDPNTFFDITGPVNTPGGPLKGYEFNYQQPFAFLPGFWKDFGVLFNYTHVESQIKYVTSTTSGLYVTDDLVNLSPNSYNATLYYENKKFSARVSAAYRDDYLQTVPGRPTALVNDVEGKRGTTNVDFAMSYAVDDNFTLTFEGINLTDTFNDQFVSSQRDNVSVYNHTGRQYYVGFRYNF